MGAEQAAYPAAVVLVTAEAGAKSYCEKHTQSQMQYRAAIEVTAAATREKLSLV